MRVADRHHCGTREERGEQIGLHHRGVLVLVEQHDAEPLAHLVGDRRVAFDDLVRAGHLIREVDDADAALLRGVLAGEISEQREGSHLLLGGDHVGVDDRRLRRRWTLQHVAEAIRERGEVVERHEVVHPVARDPQRGVHDAADRLATTLEARVVGGEHHAPHEQPRRRFREHDGLGIPPDPQRMLADDLVREAVVGRDGRPVQERVVVGLLRRRSRRLDEGVHGRMPRRGCARALAGTLDLAEDVEKPSGMQPSQVRHQPAPLELAEALQPALDALGQLARGLAGEGQAEDLVATDDPVRDEPDHARGHRLGLAAAGAGDHERGLERRLDHGRLLIRRGELAERRGDDRRRQDAGGHGCRHDALTAPIV